MSSSRTMLERARAQIRLELEALESDRDGLDSAV